MPASRMQLRRQNTLIALGLAALCVWFFTSHRSRSGELIHSHEQFWRDFHPLLADNAPDCQPPIRLGNAESAGFDPQSTEPLPDLLRMPAEDIARMKQAHTAFANAIERAPPELNYQPHTRGLVSTAGGPYLPVLLISLRMLRRTGSTLPMEVFLADWEEYDGYLCQVVLPSLNAQCVVLSEILEAVPDSTNKIEKYQYKIFAMLFSSFEEILFLDADAFPLQKPEELFTADPFKSKGLVTWPDFWRPTTSPLYYKISSPKESGTQPAKPTALRQSTESGEVLVSKRTHLRTLLLAAYYNFYGPSHYYPLLSQGAAGEGDKETFLAAANALDEPFYQVSEPIRAVGRRTPDGFAGSTMVQYSPMEDYALTKKGIWRVKGVTAPTPSPFFVHVNYPKFNPATIFAENGVTNPVIDERGQYTLAWTAPEEVVASFGDNFQHMFWEDIHWTACVLEGKILSWKGKTGICQQTRDYWNSVFKNSAGTMMNQS
ncbi:hypothetical protein ASPACDRAFT_57427 [Aspergillus aculeatus ATCC 16872]|uniref:Glycosyltransferase family 71 protein n=1 Tax=Aspergillus aculeatus (strain ATCC 16872 / CBS 172.66 / WB 5094) TaxID=690307 RepID=A0A1L9X6L3_ASPA1|nr:uncharacterized protein ASPACDRAFT_57427 [Aspergillus aculeatus ATCC 16872]OJK04090.1 hypothetical protein ASPACDRAFT_57427 [Aspergillus aculeatus ATCC 16872]